MDKCEMKGLQAALVLIKHNQAYIGAIQVCSGIFRTLCNPGKLVLWYIQNPDIFNTRSIFTSPVFSERCYIQI